MNNLFYWPQKYQNAIAENHYILFITRVFQKGYSIVQQGSYQTVTEPQEMSLNGSTLA